VAFQPEAVIADQPDIADLVPSETSASPIIESSGASSFPKVLRSRLDRFFADRRISPKADRTMWVKIAMGLAVLAGAWIAPVSYTHLDVYKRQPPGPPGPRTATENG